MNRAASILSASVMKQTKSSSKIRSAAPRGTPMSPAALAGGNRQRFPQELPTPSASHCASAAKPRPCALLGAKHRSAFRSALSIFESGRERYAYGRYETSHATAVPAAATEASAASVATTKHEDTAAHTVSANSKNTNEPDWAVTNNAAPNEVTQAPQNSAAAPNSNAHATPCPAQCVHRGNPNARMEASRPVSRSYATFPAHTSRVYVHVHATARGKNLDTNP